MGGCLSSQLFYDVAPKTAENFRALCTGNITFDLHGNFFSYKTCLLGLDTSLFLAKLPHTIHCQLKVLDK